MAVFALAILIIRIGNRRMFGQNTMFDYVIGIMLGSVLSRAINGSAPFWPTITAGAVLVIVHWCLAALTFYSKTIGKWVKGGDSVLVRDGQRADDALRRNHISDADLHEALRLEGQVAGIGEVQEARLERNGRISVRAAPKVEIVEIQVEPGVQTVRLRIESS